MVRFARSRNRDLDNLEFRVGDAMNLPFEDESVEAAVSMASIKHWPDRLRGLKEMHRVLTPGGVACVLEADKECTHASARRFTSYWRYVLPGTRPFIAEVFAADKLDLDPRFRRQGFGVLADLVTQRLRPLCEVKQPEIVRRKVCRHAVRIADIRL